jgi:hypothetical protein
LIGTTKVSCHTIWTDLSAGGVNPADIDGQSKARLFTLWKDFSTGQKYAKCKEGQTSGEGENPRVDLARPVKQGLMGWPGYTGRGLVELRICWFPLPNPLQCTKCACIGGYRSRMDLLFCNPTKFQGPQQ